jgi:phosphoribosylanthranilate isomerase
MPVAVKICGLSSDAALAAALAGGADMVGLVFFPPSPRNVSAARAQVLAGAARGRARIVALMVDPSDEEIAAVVAAAEPDLLQLHGRETPKRVEEIRRLWGIGLIKAVPVAVAEDVGAAHAYAGAVDLILFDARAPTGSTRPGGNGEPFDWRALAGIATPFVLSGGLTPDNVAEAIRVTGATIVDVSSGVECRPGEKDGDLIHRFIRAAKGV